MKSHNTRLSVLLSWKSILGIALVIMLALNALPNLYQNKVSLQLVPKSLQEEAVPIEEIKKLFLIKNIEIATISQSEKMTSITLKDRRNQVSGESLLRERYANNYDIRSYEFNDAPNWLVSLGLSPIKLGLDLNGGVLFVLEVDIRQALKERNEQIADEIKSIALKERIRGVKVIPNEEQVFVSFKRNDNNKADFLINRLKRSYPNVMVSSLKQSSFTVGMSEVDETIFRKEIMDQTLKTMRGRIEELGITEAVTQRQGRNRVRIELPGVHDPLEAKRIIGATASLEFYELASGSRGYGVKKIKDKQERDIHLKGKAIFTGSNIQSANSGVDEVGKPLVNLHLDNIGGDRMSDFSKKNIGLPMATVYTEYFKTKSGHIAKKSEVISIARISQQLGSRFSITNMSSAKAAQELALLLRAGSLNAPITIVKERTIEAKLGADNIDRGLKSLSIGIGITLLFMVFWYRHIGLIANLALALNLICLLGVMSILPGAVLTLPGIAGFVLTVGMAVDTNVLIFERIKEEMRRGRKVISAIEHGYSNAFSTILDANVTTFATGLILYAIGYGPVKGFAITLCIGILTSMLTGVFVSKTLTNLAFSQNQDSPFGSTT